MGRVDVQNVTVEVVVGNDLTAEFPLQSLSQTQPQGLAVYKVAPIAPSTRLIPDLDDIEEIILPQEITEAISIELNPVHCG